jgi:hypothetical protein
MAADDKKHGMRWAAMLLGTAAVTVAVASAPVAAASPQCTQTAPNTTQCETNGSAQIVTSPPPNNNYGYWGFPIVIGGWGIGI